MRRTATRALLLCLVALILSTLLWAGAPVSTVEAVNTYESKILETFGDGIVAYWPMDEVTGTTAYDVSGNGHDGTYHGATLDQADGAGETMGRAPSFDGINDYVSFTSSLSLGTQYTVAAWARPSTIVSGHTIAAYRSTTSILPVLFQLDHNNADGRFIVRDAANQLAISSYASGIAADIWQTVIGTRAGNDVTAFVNAVAAAPATKAFNPISVNALYLGAAWSSDAAGLQNYFTGNFGHVLILSRVMTEGERTLFNDPDPLPEAATPTPLPLSHYMTLESGQPVRLDYSATAGDMLIGTLLLVFVALLAFLVYLGLAKR